jgi:hypothetical protein
VLKSQLTAEMLYLVRQHQQLQVLSSNSDGFVTAFCNKARNPFGGMLCVMLFLLQYQPQR